MHDLPALRRLGVKACLQGRIGHNRPGPGEGHGVDRQNPQHGQAADHIQTEQAI